MAEEMTTEQLVQEVLARVQESSSSIEDLESVTSLDGVKSLPAQRGDELVNVPLDIFQKPAKDAAALANAAANRADEAVKELGDAGNRANEAAGKAETATEEANTAAEAALNAAQLVEDISGAALRGATARFSRMVDTATITEESTSQTGGEVVYVRSLCRFAYFAGGTYYGNWNVQDVSPADLFMNATRTELLKDKAYLCGDALYVWDGAKGVKIAYVPAYPPA